MTPHCLSLAATLMLGCAADSGDTSGASVATGDHLGSFDDLPIADDDIQGLQQLLTDKWTYFLYEMDKYNLVRDSSTNDAMVQKMERVFASSFEFNAYVSDGSNFGDTQGVFSPRSWLEAQDVDSWNLVQGTLLVPSYGHVLHVDEPGQVLRLEGYHEHAFIGGDVRLLSGDARQLAYEVIVFEKLDGVWRVTDYEETVSSASETDIDG